MYTHTPTCTCLRIFYLYMYIHGIYMYKYGYTYIIIHLACTYEVIHCFHVHVCECTTGRSSMKQYMPMKPVKRGLKVWVMADAVNGYFCTFDVYVGRPSDGRGTEVGLGERVVLQLTERLRGARYQVFVDNFFSSCRLLETLKRQHLYACGTTRSNRRGYPETLKTVSLERGSSVFCQHGDLVASVWMDKKPVSMLSTLAQADATHTALRKQKDGTRAPVQCTDAVVLYNQYMAGVDKGDQLRQYYHVRTRCRKYYKYIFWFMFDVAITNSYILSLFAPSTMPLCHQRLKSFRLRLADQLVGSYNSRKRLGRPRSQHLPPPVPAPHNLGPLPPQTTRLALHLPSHRDSRRRCQYCLQYRDPPKRSDVMWYCKDCPGQPTLCMTGIEDGSDCFRLWHAQFL